MQEGRGRNVLPNGCIRNNLKVQLKSETAR
jgi:hypothetical protein